MQELRDAEFFVFLTRRRGPSTVSRGTIAEELARPAYYDPLRPVTSPLPEQPVIAQFKAHELERFLWELVE
jgi:hypothetical protein